MRALRLIFFFVFSLLASMQVMGQVPLAQKANEQHYKQGLTFLEQKNFVAASEQFQKFLGSKSEDASMVEAAEYYLGFCALQLKEADAESKITDFIDKHPENNLAQLANYDLGTYYYNQKQYVEAIPFLTKASANSVLGTKMYESGFRLGYAYLSQKEFNKADSAFSTVTDKEHRYTAPANYYSSYLKVKNGKYDAALIGLEKAEKDTAFKQMVPLLRCIIYYKNRNYKQVVAYGEEVLKENKADSPEEIALLVAESHYSLGEFAQAASGFSVYAQSNAMLPAALRYRMGYAFLKNKANGKAIGQLKTLTQVKADTVQKRDSLIQFAAYYLAIAYLEEGNKPFATSAFEQAKDMKAVTSIQELASFNYGKIQYDQGKYEDAIIALKQYLSQFPKGKDADDANDLLGESYLNTTNYDEALAHIEGLSKRSAKVEKAYQRACVSKGSQLYNDKDYQAAIRWFQKSLKYPTDAEVLLATHYWLGESYSALGKHNDALIAFENVVKEEKSDYYAKGNFGAGYAQYNLGEYKAAIPYFEKFVKSSERAENRDKYFDGLLRLADCEYASKNYTKALSLYQKAIIQGAPDADYAAYQRGVVCSFSGNKGQAKIAFEEVLALYKNSKYKDEAMFQLANLDFEEGNYEKAIQGFTQFIAMKPNESLLGSAYFQRGYSYGNTKQSDKAIADYKKVLSDYPSSSAAKNALLAMQEAVGTTGNVEEFNDLLKNYKAANPDGTSTEKIEFQTSKNLYFSGKYDKSIVALEDFLKNYPESHTTAEAEFYLAESYFRKGDKKQAIAIHLRVAATGKGFFYIRSVNRLGDLYLAEGNALDAEKYFKELKTGARNKKEEALAIYGLADSYYQRAQYDSTKVILTELLSRDGLAIEMENKAALLLGKTILAKGDLEGALSQLLTTSNQAQDVIGAEAQYLICSVLYEQKKFKQSLETCFDLNRKYSSYTAWYDKSFLLISDNYLALGELYQAKYTLEKILEKATNKATLELAKEKLEKVKATQIKG